MTPVAIVTGASAGIGAELARVFARKGHTVMLVARREDRLLELANEIAVPGQPAPLVLPLDLGERNAAEAIKAALKENDCEAQYVVNNAGFNLVGPAAEIDRAEQLAMIDLNMRALLDLSLAFSDSLIKLRGGILNVGSLGGVMPGPCSAVYYASKAFVLLFSEALHEEWKPLGVRVTCLCPGPVLTEFQARAGVSAAKSITPFDVPADRVAAEGYRGLMQGKRVVVPGLVPKLLFALVPRFMPRNFLLTRLEERQLKRRASH